MPTVQKPSFWRVLLGRLAVTRSLSDPSTAPRGKSFPILISILLSGILWFSFTMTEQYTVSLVVPTRVENLSIDKALISLPPRNVRVQVQGQGFQIFRMKYQKPYVLLNAAQDMVVVRESVVELPKGVQVLAVSPQVIELRKSARITRKVPVQLRLNMDLPATHDLLEPPRLLPESVLVSGAPSVLQRLQYWPTEPLSVKGLTDSLEAQVVLKDTLLGLVQRDRTSVTARFLSREFTEGSREIDVVVRGVPVAEQVVTLVPKTVRVRYRVLLADYFRAQEAPDFYAEISYETLRSDTVGEIVPVIHVPPDLNIRDIKTQPRTVRYYWRVGG